MNNNRELLEEYTQVTKELDNIRNQIVEFKNKTQEKLKSIQSEDEEMSVFLEYKNQVDKFTQDKDTKKKYKNLQKRKKQIETTLLLKQNNKQKKAQHVTDDESCDSNEQQSGEIMDDIDTLIKKYKKFVKIPIECKLNSTDCVVDVKTYVNKKPKLIPNKEKCENEDDKQIKNLYNLINSLKMEIDI